MAICLPTCCGFREGWFDRQRVEDDFQNTYGVPRPEIEHVVVLMLENRSFDNIFGNMMDKRYASGEVKPSRWDVHAQAGKRLQKDYKNIVKARDGTKTAFPVWSCDPKKENIFSPEAMGVPNGDPAEKFAMLNQCVYEDWDPDENAEVTLGGFAQMYYEREMHDEEELGHTFPDRTDFHKKRSPAMHCFLEEQVSVFTELGKAFGVSDTYFASAPCQTWPNRLFAMTGHCYGYVNNLADKGTTYDHDKMKVPQTMARLAQFTGTVIFDKLLRNGVEYSIYAGDCPLSVALSRQLNGEDEMERTYGYSDFKKHVSEGYLAPFTWIEPQYLKHGESMPTDMHPPHNVLHAQKLVADVYNTLRENDEMWSKTLFIVNCDEGVGVFDHVPPPAAPHPGHGEHHIFHDQHHPDHFAMNPFERYGTRTCCLLATPLLNPNSVVRPDDETEDFPFDHCSVIRTVLDLFVGTDAHLTDRDKLAPSIAPYLLTSARKGDLGPKPLYHKEPPKHDPTELREGPSRGGCHNVQQLMDMTDQTFSKGDGAEDEAEDSKVQGWLQACQRKAHGGAASACKGYTSHLAHYNALKHSDGTDGALISMADENES